ncbi:hypothetical protein [Ammoniphilus sp. 3BR4]
MKGLFAKQTFGDGTLVKGAASLKRGQKRTGGSGFFSVYFSFLSTIH